MKASLLISQYAFPTAVSQYFTLEHVSDMILRGNAMITQDPYDSTRLVGRVSHIAAQVNRAMLQVSDLKRTRLTGTCLEKQQNLLLHFII